MGGLNKDSKNTMMFKSFLGLLYADFEYEVSHLMQMSNPNKQYKLEEFSKLRKDIYGNFFKIVIRTLVRELHQYKENGKLFGETKEERFQYFENISSQPEFKKDLFITYPLLEELINKYIRGTAVYIVSIFNNYEKDKNQLQKYYKCSLGDIKDLSLGQGDTHNGGKSVAIIYFENCKLLYKPHDLVGDTIFGNIVDWINSSGELMYKLEKVKTLSLSGRGWQEYVEHKPCRSVDEVVRFYYRMGIFLAVFYSLGTTDLHFENIISSSEHPMFIDLETFLSNAKFDKMKTVLESGLLPQAGKDHIFDVDISGICGKSNQSVTMKTLVLINERTDEMKMEERPAIISERQNVVYLKNKIVEIEDYTAEIGRGFEKTINYFSKCKDEYIQLLKKSIKKDDAFRIVLRHTTVYSKYLSASLHPDYLSGYDKQGELFQHLLSSCTDETEYLRVLDEIKTLKTGDVPYFKFYFDSKGLYSNNGFVQDNYFPFSAEDVVAKRINTIEENLNANMDLISKSLSTALENKIKPSDSLSCKFNRKSTNEEVVTRIADDILEHTFYQKKEDAMLYYINYIYDDRVYFEPININLYEGGGIILYLAAMSKLGFNRKYFEVADKLLFTAMKIAEFKKQKPTLSVFSGTGSLIYLNFYFYFLVGDEKYKNQADKVIREILKYDIINSVIENKEYDFLGGLSGMIVFLVNILLKQEDTEVEELLFKIVPILNNRVISNDIKDIGIAHGISGYAYAYTMLFKFTGNVDYIEQARNLLLKEDTIYKRQRITKTSWCKGETGMCVARMKFLEVAFEKSVEKKLEYYYGKVISSGLYDLNNMCLCHGVYGSIEVLRKIHETDLIRNVQISKQHLDVYEKSLFNSPEDMFFGFHTKFRPDTFMNGLSGVAYSLLRECLPQLPSVLFLEI